MSAEVRVIWKADCLLGEGPIWLADEQALGFVDIKQGKLHRYVPATGGCEALSWAVSRVSLCQTPAVA